MTIDTIQNDSYGYTIQEYGTPTGIEDHQMNADIPNNNNNIYVLTDACLEGSRFGLCKCQDD